MDTTPPSEGEGTGSIPVEGIKKLDKNALFVIIVSRQSTYNQGRRGRVCLKALLLYR